MLITITTHPQPDMDALAAGVAVAWFRHAPGISVRFESKPSPEWHDPERGRYTVDVGRGPLDHHQLAEPRSTCAFLLVCEHFIVHGNIVQQTKARWLKKILGPWILNQDATGSLTTDKTSVEHILGLPKLLDRLIWRLQDDEQAWQLALFLLWDLFDAALSCSDTASALALFSLRSVIERSTHLYSAHHAAQLVLPLVKDGLAETAARLEAETNPQAVLTSVELVTNEAQTVVGYTLEQTVGTISPLSYLREVIAQQYPHCQIIVSLTSWHNWDGSISSYSRFGKTSQRGTVKRGFAALAH